MHVTPTDVLTFLGPAGEGQDAGTVQSHITVVTAMVKAYTQNRGFDPNGEPDDALAAVIISSTARMVTNPTAERQKSVTVDDGTVSSTPGTFQGWTLPELAILHTYRRRAR